MIEELLVLKAEVNHLKSIGKLDEANEYQKLIDSLEREMPKGTKHGTD